MRMFLGYRESNYNNIMINIGVFDPQGVRNLIQLGYSVIVFKLHVPDKERLIRQLNREEDPDIEEIIRRYQTDKEDFTNLDFPFISLLIIIDGHHGAVVEFGPVFP